MTPKAQPWAPQRTSLYGSRLYLAQKDFRSAPRPAPLAQARTYLFLTTLRQTQRTYLLRLIFFFSAFHFFAAALSMHFLLQHGHLPVRSTLSTGSAQVYSY